MMDPIERTARGRIDVTSLNSNPFDARGAFTLSDVHVTEEFAGDLVGVGSARFLMASQSNKDAHFMGMERFLGRLETRSGSFLFENRGTLKDGALVSTWRVVPGSGTEQLAGLRGEGGCDSQGYTLNYWFEDQPDS